MSSIREANKVFYGMVVAQAQRIDVDRDTLTFTFAPAHKTLRAQLEAKRGWIEQLAQAAAGQRMTVQAKDGEPTAPAASAAKAGDPAKAASLKARAKAEPAVQAMLDVLGGDIESVEELD